MDMPEFGNLFTTGQEYVEYIHRLPISERQWHHTAYLWYHRNAKVILLGLAICAMIYTAIVYRGLVAAAARGSSNSRRKVVMTGGVGGKNEILMELPEYNDDAPTGRNSERMKKGQELGAVKKQMAESRRSQEKSRAEREKAAAAEAAKPDPNAYNFGKFAFNPNPPSTTANPSTGAAGGTQSTSKPPAAGGSSSTNQTPTPSQLDEEKRDAKLQKKREDAAVKKAKQGDRPNYLSEGAHKRLTAAKEKMKDVGAKIKGAPKAFYKDLKSGKVTAQAKLMTQAAGARIHDQVTQNAGSVYTIIFSLFLFSGVALYFIPTIGMIGIGILTFYMFSDFVRGVITL